MRQRRHLVGRHQREWMWMYRVIRRALASAIGRMLDGVALRTAQRQAENCAWLERAIVDALASE